MGGREVLLKFAEKVISATLGYLTISNTVFSNGHFDLQRLNKPIHASIRFKIGYSAE